VQLIAFSPIDSLEAPLLLLFAKSSKLNFQENTVKRFIPCAVAMAASAAAAQPMEHILVSVPLHKKQAETALPVTVLSGDDLQRQVATTIGETLGSKPGIANSSFGPGVGRPVIRGQQGPRAVTLCRRLQSEPGPLRSRRIDARRIN
jgi:outer membrane receptor protein involved in Fe transport